MSLEISTARIFKFSEVGETLLLPRRDEMICVMTSGEYDVISPGHVSYLLDSKNKGYNLKPDFDSRSVIHVAVVKLLSQKKGKQIMTLDDRCKIISSIKGVDIVIGLDIEDDTIVNQALEIVKPDYFMIGGDRTIEDIPEWDTCQKLGIDIVTEMGTNTE